MKKYFVSYNYGKGFGNINIGSNSLTKENVGEWTRTTEKDIEKILVEEGIILKKVIILNILEIK